MLISHKCINPILQSRWQTWLKKGGLVWVKKWFRNRRIRIYPSWFSYQADSGWNRSTQFFLYTGKVYPRKLKTLSASSRCCQSSPLHPSKPPLPTTKRRPRLDHSDHHRCEPKCGHHHHPPPYPSKVNFPPSPANHPALRPPASVPLLISYCNHQQAFPSSPPPSLDFLFFLLISVLCIHWNFQCYRKHII